MKRRAIPDNRITAAQAKAQMGQFLFCCRDHMLAKVTVDELLSRYRVDRQTAEYELTAARRKRGVTPA